MKLMSIFNKYKSVLLYEYKIANIVQVHIYYGLCSTSFYREKYAKIQFFV